MALPTAFFGSRDAMDPREDRPTERRDRPTPSRWRRARRCVLPLAVAIGLALGASAAADPTDAPIVRVASPPGDLSPVHVQSAPCRELAHDGVPARAIFLDLETSRTIGKLSILVRRQRWLCPALEAPEAGRPSPGGVSLGLDAVDPSAWAFTIEARSGEVWQIGLARPDGVPLEPGPFASESAGFYVNAIESSADPELAVLDADVEVALPDGGSLWARILWNAPWNPEEPAFVPLGEDDWRAAAPGDVQITGSALERIFTALTTYDAQLAARAIEQQMDSIDYSGEPHVDPRAARREVAAEADRLAETLSRPPSESGREDVQSAATVGAVSPFLAATRHPPFGAPAPPAGESVSVPATRESGAIAEAAGWRREASDPPLPGEDPDDDPDAQPEPARADSRACPEEAADAGAPSADAPDAGCSPEQLADADAIPTDAAQAGEAPLRETASVATQAPERAAAGAPAFRVVSGSESRAPRGSTLVASASPAPPAAPGGGLAAWWSALRSWAASWLAAPAPLEARR